VRLVIQRMNPKGSRSGAFSMNMRNVIGKCAVGEATEWQEAAKAE
jgi:hypothetical protein